MERLRQFRFLIILCSLAIFAGVWDVWIHGDGNVKQNGTTAGRAGDVELPPDQRVFVEVFPNSPNSAFDLGLLAYNRENYPVALAHFKNALVSGIKTNEDLLWYNALTLLHLKKDDAQVDAAIARWRRNFPHSDNYSHPFWTFAISLLERNAAEADIDAAVKRWQRKSPDSPQPDPYWACAVRLLGRRADPAEIDAAVSRWRRKSPNSDLSDPRKFARPAQ